MKSKIQLTINNFLNKLQQSKTEEDVKSIYAKYFNIEYNTSDKHDLYTQQVLFEFKFDKKFKNLNKLAQVLAQMLYYVRKLKFDSYTNKSIPPMLCLADRNEAVLTETSQWKKFYTNDNYDWDLAASSPDKTLVDEIANGPLLRNLHVYEFLTITEFTIFAEQLQKHLKNQLSFEICDKKVITEDNFEDVFNYWNKIFGDSVRNGFKTSRYFVNDIKENSTIFDFKQNTAYFHIGQDELKKKKILAKDYNHFWNLYEKITDTNTVRAIIAKIDRLTDETMKRFHGEFFTPINFAKKSLSYLVKAIPNWQWGGVNIAFGIWRQEPVI